MKRRGYKESIIKKSFSKAHSISRSSLLQYKEKLKCKRTSCVLTYHPCLRNRFNTIRGHWTSVEKNSKLSKVFPESPMVAFKHPNSLKNLLLRTCQSLEARVTPVETHTSKVVNICNTRHRIPVRSPENSKHYFALLIARVQMLFTFLSVLFVASNTLASLSSPSTNAWMDTGVTLQKAISSCLITVSRISTEWKS